MNLSENNYLYLVRRIDDMSRRSYDENNAHIICCGSPAAARKIAADKAVDEGPDVWMSKQTAIVKRIGVPYSDIASGIVLTDFFGGG